MSLLLRTLLATHSFLTSLATFFTLTFTSANSRRLLPPPPPPIELTNKNARTREHVAVLFRRGRNGENGGESVNCNGRTDGDGKEGEGLVEEVERIVGWCLEAGVRVLTVFDEEGLLKTKAAHLHRALKSTLSPSIKQPYTIGSSTPPPRPEESDPILVQVYASGRRIPKTTAEQRRDEAVDVDSAHNSDDEGETIDLHINIVSPTDGRQPLVDAARALARKAITNTSPTIVDVDVMDRTLHKGRDASLPINRSEPQLVFLTHTDPEFITIGNFMPWEIRLSEFWPVPSELTQAEFVEGLRHMASCQQRFGK
ncbi:uncharacterized protein EV422DRAFT_212286 [Fimicolochytrium jonesii]|uniref:uncharacterized protein n=1 Tax=Fimicolochytrium jonesii TaxID=1396493 RepID=UPI0022FF07D8|nr:uncharacterized protein EV422DRAFT_212286 [Fimicolochytrium jonesii]KAI8817692.1 hypothetical protein EV422DRAFT_212286 [Fimicolochytrium jonesii]